MKKIFYLILFLPLILSSCISSKRISYLSTPDSSKPDTINFKEYEEKYSKYDGVYLNLERTIEHTCGKTIGPWNLHSIRKEKYMVLNPDNQKLTTFELTVGKNCEIGNLYLRVCSPEGIVKQYGKLDLKEEINSEKEITYKFIYPDIKKGYVIEEGYELSYNAFSTYVPLEHDIELQFYVPCEKFSFKYAYPDWWKINTKKISDSVKIDYKVIQDSLNNKTILHYYDENIPAIEDEPYSPYFKEMAKYLNFRVTELIVSDNIMKYHKTWEEFGSNFKDYAMNKNGFLSTRVSDVTDEIITDCRSDYEKLDKIITYIQENIEVVHDGKNRNFADILKDKRGDYLRINGLAQSMLAKAGLSAEYLLIHSAENGYFDPDYISNEQFTFPAIRTVINGNEYVVLPYEKYYPVDFIPEYIQGQTVLIISNNEKARLSKVGFSDLHKDGIDEKYDLNIDESGVIHVKEQKSINGSFAFFIRNAFSDISEEKKDKFVKDMLTYSDGDVKVMKYEILNMDSCKEPLIIKFEYEIDNLVTVTPQEVIFQTGGLFSPSSLRNTKIDTDKRQNPIKVYYNSTYSKDISITYPGNWKIQNELPDITFENTFGKIVGQYEINNGIFKAQLQQQLKRCSAPKEKIVDLLEVSGTQSKLTVPAIVFKIE